MPFLYFIQKILKSFLPFIWSKDPCDTPIVKISSKHINGEILKLFILKTIKEKIHENKKKIKE